MARHNWKRYHAVMLTVGTGLMAMLAAAAQPQGRTGRPDAPINGADVYAGHCASCHGPELKGPVGPNVGVPLRGPQFIAKWRDAPPDALLDYIKATMPLNDPGSLAAQDYVAITDFVRARNGLTVTQSAVPAASAHAATTEHFQTPSAPSLGPPDEAARAAGDKLAALASRLSPVSDAMLHKPSPDDWLSWRQSQGTSGFSPLHQIDRSNVARLTLAWSLSLGNGTNGLAPLVHDGLMFLNSNGTTRALDATSGDLIWEHVRPATTSRVPASQPRGIALYDDSVFVPTVDNHVLALDARTGRVQWDHEIGKPADKLQLTAAPLIVKGKVIQGVSGCQGSDYAGGCFIVALDAATGTEAWRFNTIARPGKPDGDSWNGLPVEQRFGGSVWTTGSYDPDLDLVYFGTGQTYVVSTLLRPSRGKSLNRDALYTDTTLALDPDTGKLVWRYQHAAADVWDMDWAFERSLATQATPTGTRKIIVTAGKPGIVDVIDGKTGRYLWSHDMGLQNVISAIDPRTGRKSYDMSLVPEHGKIKFVCPSAIGARNWPTSAIDPGANIAYFPMFETCMDLGLAAAEDSGSRFTNFGEFVQRPRKRADSDGNFGRLVALDLNSRQVAWTRRFRAPPISALLTTGGGLLFVGGQDRWFRALDSATGDTLWQTRVDNVPNGFPLTFAARGRQYVAIVTGGGSAVDLFLKQYTPEIPSVGSAKTLLVFALAGAGEERAPRDLRSDGQIGQPPPEK